MMRTSGILLHITSLPSPFGIGDMGPGAYRFADFLEEAGQKLWQMLPLNPTAFSPYHSSSAFACNPYLISPEVLVNEGLLEEGDLAGVPDFPGGKVDFEGVLPYKRRLLSRAFENFNGDRDFTDFCQKNSSWLEDFALFKALRTRFGYGWHNWPVKVRDRDPETLQSLREELGGLMEEQRFYQFIFHRQWQALRRYCRSRGIRLFGDMPIYVDHDSADMWTHPDIFKLDDERRPRVVAGVPPDYFSKTGQLWGNPIYDWDALKEKGFSWWVERTSRNLESFDLLRIDHFRGLVAYWEVPKGEETAMNGRWVEAPADDLLTTLRGHFPRFPIIAEDLGIITPDVWEVMERFQIPGMKVLLFAFGGDVAGNPYLPHNVARESVIYTGTHDTNTARGWFEDEVSPGIKGHLFGYLGREVKADEVPWELVRLAMMSVAETAIFPLQDVLGLGSGARMNVPSTIKGNWAWRVMPEQLTSEMAEKLRKMTHTYGRV